MDTYEVENGIARDGCNVNPFGAWITDNPNLGVKWVFLINVIIGFGFVVVMCFMPETCKYYVMTGQLCLQSCNRLS